MAEASIEQRIAAALTPEPEAPPEAPAEPEAPPVRAVEVEPEAPEADVETEAPVEAAESEAAPEAAEAEEETFDVETLPELAEALDLDPAALYAIGIPVTDADGQPTTISLGEWKDELTKSFRIPGEEIKKAQRAAKESQESMEKNNAEQAELRQTADLKLQQMGMFMQRAEQTLMNDFNSVDWDGLRQSNPTEWAARRQELQERQGQIQNMHQQVANEHQNMVQRAQQAQTEQLGRIYERENTHLLEKLPEWRKDETRVAEQAELRTYLLDGGYSEKEISEAYDHRAILQALKAMKYDKLMARTDVTKKKIVRVGKKVLKPGAKLSKAEQKQDAETSLRARLRKSGSTDDAAALIQHRLGR